ncbi:MAG: hypothetical protein WCL14_03530 [Bacteroidota bacterium]
MNDQKVLKTNGLSTTLPILLFTANCIFIMTYLMFGYFTRMCNDDFAYCFRVDKMGMWNAFIFSYKTWNTRWSSILLMNGMMNCFDPTASLLLYYIFLLLLFIGSVFKLIGSFCDLLKVKPSPINLLNYSMLTCSGFFLFNMGIGETWFWMNASTIYIFPVIMFCFGLSLVINRKTTTPIYALIFLSFILAGGGNEPFVIIMICLLSLLIFKLRKLKTSMPIPFINAMKRKTILAVTAMVISFMVTAFCPGVAIRNSFLPPLSWMHVFQAVAYTSFQVMKTTAVDKVWFILPFFLIWVALGTKLSSLKNEIIARFISKINSILYIMIAFCFLNIVISAVAIHGVPPLRSLTTMTLLETTILILIGIKVGYQTTLPKRLSTMAPILLIGIYAILIFNQYPIIKAHAAAYDDRIIFLKGIPKDQKQAVKVRALPPSGWLYDGDISLDTANIQNSYLKEALHLPFSIYTE